MHTYYQTTLAITGSRSTTSRSENATDWDYTANSLGQVTGVYERIKATYKNTREIHPLSFLSSYEQTITDVNYGSPPSFPGSGETRIYSGFTSRTTEATRRTSTYSSFGSTSIAGYPAATVSWTDGTSALLGTGTSAMAYASASQQITVTAKTTSSFSDSEMGITGTVVNSVATTTTTTRSLAIFQTASTTMTRSSRANAATTAITTTQSYPPAFDTILEAEPHELAYVMRNTEYSQGFPDDIANRFVTTTLAQTTYVSSRAPMLSSAQLFTPQGIRTVQSAIGLVTTVSSLSTLTHFSADGWWPMTATRTEQITRISTSATTVVLDTTQLAAAPSSYVISFEQDTVYTTIHTTATAQFSVHTNAADNSGGLATAHRYYITVTTIHTESPIYGPVSIMGTWIGGGGTYNSYSTSVDHVGRTSLVTSTSSSAVTVTGLTSATSSTQFNPSWTERGTLQTSRENYYTSTSILYSLSSTTTDAIFISYTTIFGQSTEHYQTTRDIRSSRSTTSESGFSYYTITNSSTDTCNLPPETITDSGGTSGAFTTSETYSTIIHNAAFTQTQLFTTSTEVTFTETCAVPPGLSSSSGSTSVAGQYISQTYRSIYHNAVLIESSSSTFGSTFTNVEVCFDYPPGTETRSGETTESTRTSQTFASFSHDPLVTNSAASTSTTESITTETCNVSPTTYTASGATTYYDMYGRSETQSSTFATTVHDAQFINFNISYDTTSTSFTENCGIYNSLEEQSTVSTADNALTAYTRVTYYATLHSAPNPHTVTRMTYGTFVTYQTTYGSHTITSLTSVITITNSSTAGNNHLVTYRTSVTSSTIGTTYGTHTVSDQVFYTSTIPSSVGFGYHTLSRETRVTTTYTSSSETNTQFTSPELSYVSSSASYSETSITTTDSSSVSVHSSFISVVSVTMGSTVYTEVQGLTVTEVSRLATFANATSTDTVNVVAPEGIFTAVLPRSTLEFADAGVSPVKSWSTPGQNLVPSNGLTLYFPAIAQGQRHPSYTNFYRLSLNTGSSTYSSGNGRTTIAYLSSDVISVSTFRTTFGSTSITDTYQGTVSFSVTGTNGYYAPVIGTDGLLVGFGFAGTRHFGGLPAAGDTPGTMQLMPRVWHFTSQVSGTVTSEVSSWLQSLSSFSTSVYGFKLPSGETEVLRYCSRSYVSSGVPHLGTFTILKYPEGVSSTNVTLG